MEHANSDLNLLFGILALQMDFISRDTLIDAMHLWVRDKAKPLGRILLERHALDAEAHGLLESLVRKHLRLHADDPAKSLATLSTLAPVHADLGRITDPDLHRSLATLCVADPGEGDPLATRLPLADSPSSPTGSRFRIIRLHARGGLGEVFLAYDQELKREVALKEIQCRHADDPHCRSRFLLEAEVTGGLEHPGIVSVYGLGQYADGRPYYAMRFIRGQSLQKAIKEFHSVERPDRTPGEQELELRRLLRRFLDVCNAVTYAHSRAVLHRDLKPGNIMLGPFGETLVVDWGLAKPLHRSPCDGPEANPLRPTTTGSLSAEASGHPIGTPQYMSPEQAAGDVERLGPATDIYSLGATLYTLLTGRLPFQEGDCDSVVQRVRAGNFPPPCRIDARIPKALEAICLKAMALKPEDRYDSARALADDLEHWLADEPVVAFSEPWNRRLARWRRRHRPLMAAAAALTVSAVAALAIGTALIAREQARTERNYRLALAAVEEMLTKVGAVDLADVPQMEEVRRQLLGRALAFYNAFLRERANETGLRQDTARAHARLGDVQEMLGEYDEAEEHYRRAIALLSDLAAASPAAAEPRRLWAQAVHNFGILLKKSNRFEEAEDAFREALRLREQLAVASPADPDARQARTDTRYHLGALLARLHGRHPEDEVLYRLALEDQRRLVAEHRDRPELQGPLARYLNNLAILLQATGRPDEAETAIREAGTIQQALTHDFPASPGYRWQLARTENNLCKLLKDTGRIEEAEASLRRAIGLLTRLQVDYPRVPDYRHELAAACVNLGTLLLRDTHRADLAAEALDQARVLLTDLIRVFPKRFDYRHRLAEVRGAQGVLQAETGHPDEAESIFREDLDAARGLVAHDPDVPVYHSTLGCALDNLATLMRKRDQPDEAYRLLIEAIGHHRIALESNVRNRLYGLFLRNDWTKVAAIHRDRQEHAALATVAEELPRIVPDDPTLYVRAAWYLAFASALAAQDPALSPAERTAHSQDHARRAVELLREAFRRGFNDAEQLEQPDYAPLQGRDDFQQLLRDMRARSRPAVG
jgi:tetratricopeptide (TPR) repeat protein